jgi:hypothetical protein
MSYQDCPAAEEHVDEADGVEIIIVPRSSDIGGFEVRRALPSRKRRMVGPFIFFDQMGPADFDPGKGLDVRPHPHIGLSTVTYLFEGELMHRDSLGTQMTIRPGEINWMTAGQGIAHSERTPEDARPVKAPLSGMQAWVALPEKLEETAPGFAHHGSEDLPIIENTGVRARLLVGAFAGQQSSVQSASETLYVELHLAAGARLPIPPDVPERALYLCSGNLMVDGARHQAGQLLVLKEGVTVMLQAQTPCHLMLLGGEPMDGPRYIWWNFVSSSKERIEQAKADWQAGRFAAVPDESEWIPLPDSPGP